MRKSIILLIVIMISSLSFIGCSDKEVDKNVEGFFNAYKNLNLNEANTYVKSGGELAKEINNFENYDEKRESAIKYWASKISYKIISTSVHDDSASVKVEVTSLDGNSIYNYYIAAIKSEGDQPSNISDNIQTDTSSPNEEAYNKDDYVEGNYASRNNVEAFIQAIENQEIPLKTTTIEINLKKDNGIWKIQNDDVVLKAILGGLDPVFLP